MIAFQVDVRVPATATAAIKLDETNASLHQATSQEAVGAEAARCRVVEAIKLARGFAFFGKLDSFRRGTLHAVGQLVGLRARLQIGVFQLVGREAPVQGCQKVQLAALLLLTDGLWRCKVKDRSAIVAELGALIGGGKKT